MLIRLLCRKSRAVPVSVAMLLMGLMMVGSTGCVDLASLLEGLGGSVNGGENGEDDSSLRVRLSVSNPTPSLNEEVVLVCSIVDDPSGQGADLKLTFEFAFAARALSVDRQSGVARFIVTESDLNVALSFICRAVTDDGVFGPTSSTVVVIPAPAP